MQRSGDVTDERDFAFCHTEDNELEEQKSTAPVVQCDRAARRFGLPRSGWVLCVRGQIQRYPARPAPQTVILGDGADDFAEVKILGTALFRTQEVVTGRQCRLMCFKFDGPYCDLFLCNPI